MDAVSTDRGRESHVARSASADPRITASAAVDLLDRLPAIVAAWDAQECCTFANRAAGQWLGLDPRSMPGVTLRDALGADLYAVNRDDIAAVLAGEGRVLDRVVVDAAGRQRTCQSSYVPRWAADGSVGGMIVHVTDITERLDREHVAGDAMHRAAMQAERHRVAEDVHDVVLQDLLVVGFDLQDAVDRGEAGPVLVRARDAVDSAVSELRATILALDEDLAPDDLATTLHRVVEEAARALRIIPELRYRGRLDAVPPGLARTLVAVLVEALAGVGRRTPASRVVVEFSTSPDALALTVSDDGVDATPGASDLVGLRRRAQLHGGRVTVTTGALGGTAVSWWTPLDPAVDPAPVDADLTRLGR